MRSFQEFVQNHESKRGHFMDYWRSLRNTDPLYMDPISKGHVGHTKGEDTIRLTGSPKFIASIVSRLKELMIYENDRTKLDISYKESTYTKENGQRSYILYLKLRER
jgi:hypothetical protein